MTNFLTVSEWATAVRMRRNGRDTLEIADRLQVREAVIYLFLPVYRSKWTDVELRFSA